MHNEAIRLYEGYVPTFASADREVRWLGLEQERSLWLDDDTVVIGKIDANGVTGGGDPFFLDLKTASKNKARFIEAEKVKWKMSPQALTYGLLMGRDCKRFTVRWAMKTVPATYAFEWYEYSLDEMLYWEANCIRIADEIRRYRREDFQGYREVERPFTSNSEISPMLNHWPQDLGNCAKYGENYACPFRNNGCWKLDFEHVPEGMLPRVRSHVPLEDKIRAEHKDNPRLVVLGATRITDWQSCRERYRRLWENGGLNESGEALDIGTDFHSLVQYHLEQIKKEQDALSSGTSDS